jgi:aspartate oxidase
LPHLRREIKEAAWKYAGVVRSKEGMKEGLVKLLGSEGVDILRKKKEMNLVLAQMAKMMAGLDKIDLPGGEIHLLTSLNLSPSPPSP